MKKILSLFLLLILISGCSYRLANYHISTDGQTHSTAVSPPPVIFLQPPGSRLKISKEGWISLAHRYQVITIRGLDRSYKNCLDRIAKAEFRTSLAESGVLSDTTTKQFDNGALFVRLKHQNLEIIIDYYVLLSRPNLIQEFNLLSGYLINAIASRFPEPTQFPATMTQNIVKKVFDLIPYPVQSTSARYGYSNNLSNFMLMFDEDLRLQMDAVERIDDGVNAPRFAITGTYPFAFHRDDQGDISQNPIMGANKPTEPPNTFQTGRVHLIASFADLQNSSELRGDPFIVIFSPTMKRNNTDSKSNPYSPADDATSSTGNFMLINLKQPEIASFDFTATAANAFDNYDRSVFGLRAQGKVVFDITVNGQTRTVTLGERIHDLHDLPRNIKVFRMQNGKFRRVRRLLHELVLLPGDQIIFSL